MKHRDCASCRHYRPADMDSQEATCGRAEIITEQAKSVEFQRRSNWVQDCGPYGHWGEAK